jgi:hypothetical protein
MPTQSLRFGVEVLSQSANAYFKVSLAGQLLEAAFLTARIFWSQKKTCS